MRLELGTHKFWLLSRTGVCRFQSTKKRKRWKQTRAGNKQKMVETNENINGLCDCEPKRPTLPVPVYVWWLVDSIVHQPNVSRNNADSNFRFTCVAMVSFWAKCGSRTNWIEWLKQCAWRWASLISQFSSAIEIDRIECDILNTV